MGPPLLGGLGLAEFQIPYRLIRFIRWLKHCYLEKICAFNHQDLQIVGL